MEEVPVREGDVCWMSRLQLKDSNHKESYEGTQLGQIKYIVNCTEQTTEGIHGHIYGTASETCNETGARPY